MSNHPPLGMGVKSPLPARRSFSALAALFGLIFLLAPRPALAVDYTWINSGGGFWTGNTAAREAGYGTPTPPSSGPLGTDNLTITANGTLALQNSGTTLVGGMNRAINNLSSSVAGANIASGATNAGVGFTSLTVNGDISLSTSGHSLTFYNSGAAPTTSAAMTVSVAGNVNIAAGTSLYLGLIQDTGIPTGGNNYGSYLNGFTANSTEVGKGQINVDGKFMLHRNTTSVTLGDVNVGSAGVVTLTGIGAADLGQSGTFNKTIQARSLTGSGILENSIVITGTAAGPTSSNATLVLNTLASTDATFSGILRDGAGSNATLNLTVTGSGQQRLTGDNTYSGTTLVSAGTLLIDGAQSGTGTVTVESGGILGGGGSIGGSLSLLAGGQFVFSLTETLTVNGASVSFGGFGIDSLVGLDSSVGLGTYILIDGTAAFDFTNVLNMGVENAVSIGGGKSAYFQSGSLQVVVVPEPTSALLLVMGAAGLWATRRRVGRA